MKTNKILFILLSVLLMVSCTKDVVDTTGNIMGIVHDTRTYEPLSGVGVTINPLGKTVATGSDGRFEFVNVQAQSYTVQAKKANYNTEQKTVTVNAGQDSQLDIFLTPSVANLVVSQSSFDFGSDATTLSLDISNDGYAVLDWYISEDISWLSFTPSSGKIQAGEKSAVVLNVDRTGLDRGNYSGTFSISSNGGSKDLRVNMLVQGITVSVAPDQLDFGPTASVLPITLKNNGSSTASYSLSTSNNWIKLEKKTGSLSPSASEQLKVSVDRTGMTEGDYNGVIELSVGDKQQDIPVKMNIPSKAKPSVYLSGVTDVTYSNAVFNASITSIGSATVSRHGFCWGTEENPTVENAMICNFGDCSEAKEFTHRVIDLVQTTTYYVRAYAENKEGISYSNQEKFVTPGVPSVPGVETGAASNVQAYQVEVGGVISSLGNVESISQYGHVWSTKSLPTTSDYKTTLGQTWSTGSYTSTLTGLLPNVTYHVRAYATNEKGTAYGEDVEFTTDYGVVTLTTAEATDIMSKSAKVKGAIKDKGGHKITERGVCWSLSSTPSVSGNTLPVSTMNDEFTASLNGLSAETAYYVCSYARTERGDVYYGNVISFTTPSKEVNINVGDYDDEEYWEK